MGQKPEKPLTYVELVHRFLKKGGAEVSKSQLLDCLQVLIIIPGFQKMELLVKKYKKESERILKSISFRFFTGASF